MGKLTGVSTAGVGADIISFLTAVADYFDNDLAVTSGKRSPDGQAEAMLKNWVKMENGKTYKKATLPETDRATLDGYYQTTVSAKATAAEKTAATAGFLKLAKEKVGGKSLHVTGRAVDITQAGVPNRVYRAILLGMNEVKEGNPPRTDIYHFESSSVIAPVNEAMKKKWAAIKTGAAFLVVPGRGTAVSSIC